MIEPMEFKFCKRLSIKRLHDRSEPVKLLSANVLKLQKPKYSDYTFLRFIDTKYEVYISTLPNLATVLLEN